MYLSEDIKEKWDGVADSYCGLLITGQDRVAM